MNPVLLAASLVLCVYLPAFCMLLYALFMYFRHQFDSSAKAAGLVSLVLIVALCSTYVSRDAEKRRVDDAVKREVERLIADAKDNQ